MSLNEGAEKFEKARKVLRSLSDMHLSAAATYAKAEEARAAGIRWWMFFGIGAALVSAIAVSLVLARSIARPLAETVDLLRDIADGEGDLTKRLDVRSKDEIGDLGRWFNTFVDKLTTIIGSVRLTSTNVTGASQQLSGATSHLASGTQEQGMKPATAQQIWDQMYNFASYGFGLNHSAAYAVLSYHTAYLKANYLHEFMATNLSSIVDKKDKLALYVNDCRHAGIAILPPDINVSESDFTVTYEDGKPAAIRMGAAALRRA